MTPSELEVGDFVTCSTHNHRGIIYQVEHLTESGGLVLAPVFATFGAAAGRGKMYVQPTMPELNKLDALRLGQEFQAFVDFTRSFAAHATKER